MSGLLIIRNETGVYTRSVFTRAPSGYIHLATHSHTVALYGRQTVESRQTQFVSSRPIASILETYSQKISGSTEIDRVKQGSI